MLDLIIDILLAIGTAVAALAVGGVCIVGLVVWLAGGRERGQQ
jgi:hypothetical protein